MQFIIQFSQLHPVLIIARSIYSKKSLKLNLSFNITKSHICLERVTSISKALGLHQTTERGNYSHMEKTWNSGKPSQECPTDHNYSKLHQQLIQEVTKELLDNI
ncbi:hypothetical protein XENOCAPTIV_010072 [Xenoophorus captivus]|uniref:Uncharacterized protein n=1 Tax=Xenoophorus captivus TaxID=1517983 RepID=A0ABV0RY34_9TELE